jgi:hypothetical protein
MMVGMRLQKIMGITVVLALLTALAAGLSVLNSRNAAAGSPTWVMISRFVVVLVFGSFGLAVARESQIQGSLFIGFEDWSLTLRDIINYGVLPGFVLGLINYFFFFTYRYSPNVESRIRDIHSIYDSFLVSLGSVGEETVFRLFILSCFLFSFRQLYSRLARLWPSVVAVLPKALSVVLSSLLFAMAHTVDGFTAAFFGGILLGLIYIQSGIESAIAAHFCANFLFFSASYLS